MYCDPSTVHVVPTTIKDMSLRKTSFSIPCQYQTLSCVTNHGVRPLSILRPSLNLWPQGFVFQYWTQYIQLGAGFPLTCSQSVRVLYLQKSLTKDTHRLLRLTSHSDICGDSSLPGLDAEYTGKYLQIILVC